MWKFLSRLISFTAVSVLFLLPAYSQQQGKLELYRSGSSGMPASFQPRVHFQSSTNWFGEARYNYEAMRTFTVLGGRNFSGGKDFYYSFTPVAGYSIGEFEGVTLGVNTVLEWNRLYYSSQSQFSIATKNESENFLYSWNDLGIEVTNNVFAGISLQLTIEPGNTYLQPGLFAGITMGNFEIPFYLFNPFLPEKSFVIGLSYEYNWKSKNK